MKIIWILSAMFIGNTLAAPMVAREDGLNKRQVSSRAPKSTRSYTIL